jgi:hypothetical protein
MGMIRTEIRLLYKIVFIVEKMNFFAGMRHADFRMLAKEGVQGSCAALLGASDDKRYL